MSHDNDISHRMQERQIRLGRVMAKNGITLKAISIDSGIPYNTVRSYFPGERDLFPSIMPITALVQLFGVIPDEWLSILTEPEGRVFSRSDEADDGQIKALQEAHKQIGEALAKAKAKAGAV